MQKMVHTCSFALTLKHTKHTPTSSNTHENTPWPSSNFHTDTHRQTLMECHMPGWPYPCIPTTTPPHMQGTVNTPIQTFLWLFPRHLRTWPRYTTPAAGWVNEAGHGWPWLTKTQKDSQVKEASQPGPWATPMPLPLALWSPGSSYSVNLAIWPCLRKKKCMPARLTVGVGTGSHHLSHRPGFQTNHQPTWPKNTVPGSPAWPDSVIDRSQGPRIWVTWMRHRDLLWQ